MAAAPAPNGGVPIYLFVAGDNPSSLTAYGNIQLALETFAAGDFALEIINVKERPERALSHGVLVTPTLLAPSISRRLIGDLSKWTHVQLFLRSLLRTPPAEA